MTSTASHGWRALGASVRGASHGVSGAPNQDAVSWTAGDGADRPLVLAVADGHGSPHCFRSDAGSRFAVAVALEVLSSLETWPETAEAREHLARRLVDGWLERVRDDLAHAPFRPDERAQLTGDDPDDAALLAYGSTLLAIAIREGRLLYAQLGDGDILAVREDGSAERIFPKDPMLASNETHSLCQPQAWRELRVALASDRAAMPELVIASTDGYSNSFASDPDFFQIGADFGRMIRELGSAAVAAQLEAILDGTSRAGSRDDITAGLLTRIPPPADEALIATPQAERIARSARPPARAARSFARDAGATLAALVGGAVIGAALVVAFVTLVRRDAGWPAFIHPLPAASAALHRPHKGSTI